jgi:hypothetical protein
MLNGLIDIIGKFIPDKDKAKELEAQVLDKHINAVKQVKLEQANIIKSEQASGAGKWRPRLMYMCMFMILTHFTLETIIPYFIELLGLFEFDKLDEFLPIIPSVKPLSPELWSFIKLGIGGYISSRGLEKIVEKGIKEWRK